MKASRKGLRTQNHAAYIKLLCERRAGELLLAMPRANQKDKPGRGHAGEKVGASFGRTLEEAGIDKHEADRWQLYAKWPIEEIEKLEAWCNDGGDELTAQHAVTAAQGYLQSATAVVISGTGEESLGGWMVLAAAFYGGVGTDIGVAIDALIRGNPLIYERPPTVSLRVSPMVTPEPPWGSESSGASDRYHLRLGVAGRRDGPPPPASCCPWPETPPSGP